MMGGERITIGDIWLDESVIAEIEDCKSERCIVKRLAAIWGGEYEVDYGWIKVDIVVGRTAVEVKFNAREYEGIGQALAYKRVLKFENSILIHVQETCEDEFVNRLTKIVENLPLSAVVIDITKRRIVVVKLPQVRQHEPDPDATDHTSDQDATNVQ